MIGQTILQFKILKKLGEGGMGVVYQGVDNKLERTVALKFLPRKISAQDDVKKRFKIEAKAAAALNHPNIYLFPPLRVGMQSRTLQRP